MEERWQDQAKEFQDLDGWKIGLYTDAACTQPKHENEIVDGIQDGDEIQPQRESRGWER